MTEKFDEEDAKNLYWIIQRRRPQWHWKGIMHSLQQAASRGASLTQVMAAAEKTWNNQKATTPAAILWPEHWSEVKGSKTAGSIMDPQLCIECLTRHDVTEMTKHAHGWVCNSHQEDK
jgi:hypothetical protein